MKNEMIISRLQDYNNDELFYKEYYEASKTKESLTKFLSNLNKSDLIKRKLIVPDLIPEVIPSHISDLSYFNISNNKNVLISKHNRYTPVFSHNHEFFEMVYVLSGSCVQQFDVEKKTMFSGDLCLISENVNHTIEVFDDSIILNILIRRGSFDDIFFNIMRDKGVISSFFIDNLYSNKHMKYLIFHTKNNQITENKILEMYNEQLIGDEYSNSLINNMLSIFFIYLMRFHKNSVELPESYSEEDNESYELINYIQNNYSSVTLEDVANRFHFSVPYCSKLIKSKTGHTFSEILRIIRMRRSEIMLLSSQMSISSISSSLGYENPESFIRAFKKHYKISPSQFRSKFVI